MNRKTTALASRNSRHIIMVQAFGGSLKELTPKQTKQIDTAMYNYAFNEVANYKTREIKSETSNWIKDLFSLQWNNIILVMRLIYFRKARRNAQLRADTEGYKMYVMRGSLTKYQIISTLQFKYNKRIRVFDKDLTAIEMEKAASFVAFPKGSPGAGVTGFDLKESTRKEITNTQIKKKRTLKKRHNNQAVANPKNKKPEDEKKEDETQEKE